MNQRESIRLLWLFRILTIQWDPLGYGQVSYDSDEAIINNTSINNNFFSHFLGSHSEYFQTFYKPTMLGPVDIYYWKNPHCKLSVKAGDAVFMDTRVMHCASQNLSSIDRMLFHFSFKTVDYEKDPTGFTYHILPDLKDKITLREFLMEKDIEEEDNEEEYNEEERI